MSIQVWRSVYVLCSVLTFFVVIFCAIGSNTMARPLLVLLTGLGLGSDMDSLATRCSVLGDTGRNFCKMREREGMVAYSLKDDRWEASRYAHVHATKRGSVCPSDQHEIQVTRLDLLRPAISRMTPFSVS